MVGAPHRGGNLLGRAEHERRRAVHARQLAQRRSVQDLSQARRDGSPGAARGTPCRICRSARRGTPRDPAGVDHLRADDFLHADGGGARGPAHHRLVLPARDDAAGDIFDIGIGGSRGADIGALGNRHRVHHHAPPMNRRSFVGALALAGATRRRWFEASMESSALESSTLPPSGSITDVEGVRVGHFTDPRRPTGCTVILYERGAVAGVDVRGSAPGTRETDLLEPTNLVDKVNAIVLSGGSAFGLDAATGVVRYLEEHDAGFATAAGKVPIVPAAI